MTDKVAGCGGLTDALQQQKLAEVELTTHVHRVERHQGGVTHTLRGHRHQTAGAESEGVERGTVSYISWTEPQHTGRYIRTNKTSKYDPNKKYCKQW